MVLGASEGFYFYVCRVLMGYLSVINSLEIGSEYSSIGLYIRKDTCENWINEKW